jgi:hypothetical protein
MASADVFMIILYCDYLAPVSSPKPAARNLSATSQAVILFLNNYQLCKTYGTAWHSYYLDSNCFWEKISFFCSNLTANTLVGFFSILKKSFPVLPCLTIPGGHCSNSKKWFPLPPFEDHLAPEFSS